MNKPISQLALKRWFTDKYLEKNPNVHEDFLKILTKDTLEQKNFIKPYEFDYIYLGCFAGIPEMVKQEVNIIRQISTIMMESDLQINLVVRPYPVLQDWSLYDPLNDISNLIIDDSFKTKDLSTSEDKIFEKFIKIHFAKAFFHMGTTMGLEACFTSTPSFIIDFGYDKVKSSKLSIKYGIHQYQNKKYLIDKNPKNVINSEDYLKNVLSHIGHQDYKLINQQISEAFELISFQTFVERLTAN